MRVLVVTSEWPTAKQPEYVPFLVQQVEELRRQNITVEVFAFRGSSRLSNYLRAWRSLHKNKGFDNFDLIHAHWGQSGFVALFPKRYPMVVTFHGSDLNGIYSKQGKLTVFGWILRRVSQLVALRTNASILVSQALAKHLPAKVKYCVIPCGINFEIFRPMPQKESKKKLGLPDSNPLILFTGGVDNPIKRFKLAQDSVYKLKQDGFDANLLIANDVHPSEMPLYMNAADLLLLTSVREGSPTVVKEALACNLPVVSVDVGDVRERLQHVKGCVVCEDDNVETISKALQTVLQNGKRVNGRTAIKDLDIRHTTRRVIDVYEHTLRIS